MSSTTFELLQLCPSIVESLKYAVEYGLWSSVLCVNVVNMPDVSYIVLLMRDMRISLRWNEYLRILRYTAVYTYNGV